MRKDRLVTEVIEAPDINDELIRQWAALSRRVKDVNPYLTPEFALPALKRLVGNRVVYIVAVWTSNEKQTLCGLGIFFCRPGDRHFPLAQLINFKSIHSFLGGILLDESMGENAFYALLHALRKRFPWRFGIRLVYIDENTWLGANLVSGKIDRGVKWFELDRVQRAVLYRKDLEEQDSTDAHLSSKRRQNFRRALAKLEGEHGPVEWHLLRGREAGETVLDTFLKLENSGWKGEKNTSISSANHETVFFKEMIQAFQLRDEVFFTELKVNGEVIASTCNFIMGRRGFAFKIGWNADYREYSPGILNEVMFLRNIDLLEFDEVDSGADDSSFINSYWPARKNLVNGVLTFGVLSAAVMSLVMLLKKIKNKNWRGREKHDGS